MKKILSTLLLLLTVNFTVYSQSIANYGVTRTTGIAYTSIAATGNVVPFWRNQTVNQNDDNRSNPVPIGFDYWYNGIRYTTVSIAVNGFIDFSSTVYDGNDMPAYPSGSGFFACGTGYTYRENPSCFSSGGCGAVAPNFYNGTYLALAPYYTDLWTGGGGGAFVANSIKYLTTGVAPNRVFTVEWISMDDWASPFNSDYNFQVKLYESSGLIEFVYGIMNPSVGAPTPYASGINCIIAGGAPAATEMLEQQVNNTATFNNTPSFNLNIVPANFSKISFSPPCVANPAGLLTFTGIGNIGMTLNWPNWAPTALGYVIYESTDGITYSFASQVPAGSTSAVFTNLFAPTYWWKVQAVTEGCLTTALTGSAATLPAGTFISIANGNWSNPFTWNALAVPSLGDNVIIANPHTVIVDGPNYGCTNLTVGQGVGGTLTLGNNATARTFTIIGDLLINTGGDFEPNSAFVATHTITALNNITNNGTLNFQPNATSLIDVSFTKNGNQTIAGPGGVTKFNNMVMNLGASLSNVLEVTSSNFAAPVNFLTLGNGTFKFSVPVNPVTLNMFSAAVTIPSSCGLWMNSPNSTMISLSTLNFQGDLTLTNGILKVGNVANESLISNGALLTITNGTMEIAGRLTRPSYVAVTNFSMTGGLMTVNTVGSNDFAPTVGTNPAYPFMIDVPGSAFRMTGGKIVVRNSGTGAAGLVNAGYCNINANPYIFTGGTVQIGDVSTSPAQTMKINTDNSIANLVINNASANNPIGILQSSLAVSNNVVNNAGNSLDCNSLNLSIAGSFTNNGTFTPGTNTLTFNGSAAQVVTGSTPVLPVNDLTINNTLGDVTLNTITDVNVAGTLLFNSGNLIIGNTNVNITSGNSVLGFNSSRFVVTNGTNAGGGFLKINNIGAPTRDFPIGLTPAIYLPVLNFSNSGAVDNFQARVFNNAYLNGNAGTIQTNDWVDKTWYINEGVVGGSTVNMTLQWNSSNELPGFTNINCGITGYTPTWDIPPVFGAAGGVNPWQQTRVGITSFSYTAVVRNNVILPIELTRFTGEIKNTNNLLNWETADELNSDYFDLEHSLDGVHFESITTIKGAGTSNTPKNYNYMHLNPEKAINYYRLKQNDFDKSYKYSNIVPINNLTALEINDASIYPNPTKNSLNLNYSASEKSDFVIEINDAIGRLVYKTNFISDKGINTKLLDIKGIDAGVYEVKIMLNNNVIYKKLIIE